MTSNKTTRRPSKANVARVSAIVAAMAATSSFAVQSADFVNGTVTGTRTVKTGRGKAAMTNTQTATISAANVNKNTRKAGSLIGAIHGEFASQAASAPASTSVQTAKTPRTKTASKSASPKTVNLVGRKSSAKGATPAPRRARSTSTATTK